MVHGSTSLLYSETFYHDHWCSVSKEIVLLTVSCLFEWVWTITFKRLMKYSFLIVDSLLHHTQWPTLSFYVFYLDFSLHVLDLFTNIKTNNQLYFTDEGHSSVFNLPSVNRPDPQKVGSYKSTTFLLLSV